MSWTIPRLTSAIFAVLLALMAGLPATTASVASVPSPSQSSPVSLAAPGIPGMGALAPLVPVDTGFTYQGRLKDNGVPINSAHDFTFKLYDALAGGNQVGTTITLLNQTVTDGLFTVTLDFGSVFLGQARWLEIAVRPAGVGGYTTLLPRQSLTAAPYAMSLVPGAQITTSLTTPALRVSSTGGDGLYARSTATDGFGLSGESNTGPDAAGVYGESASGSGLKGVSTVNNGEGVYGEANTGVSAKGVYGTSNSGKGVYGRSLATNGHGVYGVANGDAAKGVNGESSSGTGVYGWSNKGDGVSGHTTSGHGVYGHSTSDDGVYGETDSSNGAAGVYGLATGGSGRGVIGVSSGSEGVYGQSSDGDGVFGTGDTGVHGSGFAYGGYFVGGDIGVRGFGPTWAGYFVGDVHVTGSCCAAGAGYSTIDHPLDPANKDLSHAFVESPDMKTVYDGNITTDARGEAVVVLPAYFEALNKDFRYQLTVVGQFADAIVATEIQDNRFSIKTDKPNVKVSWQVTGIRKDPYAEQHRILVEVDKPQKGTYRHPAEWGQPESLGIDYEENRRLTESASPDNGATDKGGNP